jgi:hypothetical protein
MQSEYNKNYKFPTFCCLRDKCQTSCCGAFNGVSERISSVEDRKHTDIILTPSDMNRIIDSKYKDLIIVGEDGLGRVRTTDNGRCLAYDNGICKLNEVKPTICCCYPLYLDMFSGVCTINDCPSVRPEYDCRSYIRELSYLIEMYEFWIDYYKKKFLW